MLMNPGFYGVVAASAKNIGGSNTGHAQPTAADISTYCSSLIQGCVKRLSSSGCITVTLDSAEPTVNCKKDRTRLVNKNALAGSKKGSEDKKADKLAIFQPPVRLSSTALGRIST
jgi:hypothetical protein